MAASGQTVVRRHRGGVSRRFLVAFAAGLLLVLAVGYLWAGGPPRPGLIRLRLSEPYGLLEDLAHRHPMIAERLGPVRSVAGLEGELAEGDAEGWCELSLWVHGVRADGHLEARLELRGGQWFWEWANLRLEDGRLEALDIP